MDRLFIPRRSRPVHGPFTWTPVEPGTAGTEQTGNRVRGSSRQLGRKPVIYIGCSIMSLTFLLYIWPFGAWEGQCRAGHMFWHVLAHLGRFVFLPCHVHVCLSCLFRLFNWFDFIWFVCLFVCLFPDMMTSHLFDEGHHDSRA